MSGHSPYSHLSILYADDDAQIRKQAERYLATLFKEVYMASDGREALGLWEEMRPDVIISDIRMPRLDGLALVETIRRSDVHTPIILATAYSDQDYLLRAIELRLVSYLIKPVTPTKLHQALQKALAMLHQEESIIELGGGVRFDRDGACVEAESKAIALTPNEHKLLMRLSAPIETVHSYESIEYAVWGEKVITIDTLRSLVRQLRRKVPALQIESRSGFGYLLRKIT